MSSQLEPVGPCAQLRREKQDWTVAAKTFLDKQSLMQSLYKNYNSLIETATNFSTQSSGSWRKAMNSLGGQVSWPAFLCCAKSPPCPMYLEVQGRAMEALSCVAGHYHRNG